MLLKLSGKSFYLTNSQSISSQITQILSNFKTSIDNFSFFANGKCLQSFQDLPNLTTILAVVPLKGGKGGYGAKLKTEGGKKVRPNDNMFSRDTHGQKVVYATMQKQYKQFVRKKIEEDKIVAQQRQQYKVMENTLREGQSFLKLDRAYKKQIQTTERNLSESIMIGKQRLMEKYKLDKAQHTEEIRPNEEKEGILEEQKAQNIQQANLKRALPNQFNESISGQPLKKQKLEDNKSAKPVFLSAQQKFKLLFKKG